MPPENAPGRSLGMSLPAISMNGANHQEEGDRAPLLFCPECDAKLWWACQLKPKERAQNLASFAKINGLKAEETAWSAVADALPSDS